MIISEKLLKINDKYIFPINDISAYLTFDDYQIIYNKLFLSQIQNLDSNPIPIVPLKFPVVIKPIINLNGMSKGFYKINSEEEYNKLCLNKNLAGYFYQSYLSGTQYNYDIIIRNGKILDYFCTISYPLEDGMFDYHEYIPKKKSKPISKKNIKILEDLLEDYSGFINVEIIDDFIIEAHLRLNGDMFIFSDTDCLKLVNFYLTNVYDKINIFDSIYFIPFFTNDIKIDFKKIEYLLKEDYILKYKFDNVFSINQSENKRFLYFTTNDLEKSLELRKKIYNLLYINGR